MVQQSRVTSGPWDLYFSRSYADLWYGARAAGERVRGLALERLYRSRPIPGGPHPDPRKPAAFSSQAILSMAAELLRIQLNPMLLEPTPHVPRPEVDVDEQTGLPLPFAWLVTHTGVHATSGIHSGEHQHYRMPEVVIRTLHANHQQLEFEVACLLGYWQHEHDLLDDPDAPPATILLPRTPGVVALLHQYAIALLLLQEQCPPDWTCQCNEIRRRFNAPPPDHDRPTGTFTEADLEAERARRRTDTEPRFPYRDNNAWTGER